MSGSRPGPLILHVSDPHLGSSAGRERAERGRVNWEAFAREAEAQRPDLVVVTGDVVVDDPDDDADHAAAFELLSRLDVPWAVVPGNHDVGDHTVRAGLPPDWHGKLVSDERVRRWEDRWGASWWSRSLGDCTVIGLNSQLFGSGLRAEARQWEWLQATLADRAHRPYSVEFSIPRHPAPEAVPEDPTRAICKGGVVVFLHESIDPRPEATPVETWMAVPREPSRRLRTLLENAGVGLVGSGHTHRFLEWTSGTLRQVSAPSLAGPIPERTDMDQPAGHPAAGWLEMRLSVDGEAQIAPRWLGPTAPPRRSSLRARPLSSMQR